MRAFPPRPLLFDTGIYIRLSRMENYLWLREDAQIFRRTILTAVVASELYAGTRSRGEKRALDELCRAHQALGNFSTPNADAWRETGVLLRRARKRFGQMEFAAGFRDLLIAMEAVRTDATLVSENAEDFARWKGLLEPTRKMLRVFKPA